MREIQLNQARRDKPEYKAILSDGTERIFYAKDDKNARARLPRLAREVSVEAGTLLNVVQLYAIGDES